MPMQKPFVTRRCLNYKKRAAPVITKIEEPLCDEMGLTISELHILSLKRLWNARQNKELLELV